MSLAELLEYSALHHQQAATESRNLLWRIQSDIPGSRSHRFKVKGGSELLHLLVRIIADAAPADALHAIPQNALDGAAASDHVAIQFQHCEDVSRIESHVGVDKHCMRPFALQEFAGQDISAERDHR